TAIGIEHVGMSDGQVLGNSAQMRSSLRLTAWLQWRVGIKLRNVIGHNESLTSPFHHELYAAWRCQTHGDWTHADMDVYRGRLRGLDRRYGVEAGPPARPVSSGGGRRRRSANGPRPPMAADTMTTAPTAIRTSPTEYTLPPGIQCGTAQRSTRQARCGWLAATSLLWVPVYMWPSARSAEGRPGIWPPLASTAIRLEAIPRPTPAAPFTR